MYFSYFCQYICISNLLFDNKIYDTQILPETSRVNYKEKLFIYVETKVMKHPKTGK